MEYNEVKMKLFCNLKISVNTEKAILTFTKNYLQNQKLLLNEDDYTSIVDYEGKEIINFAKNKPFMNVSYAETLSGCEDLLQIVLNPHGDQSNSFCRLFQTISHIIYCHSVFDTLEKINTNLVNFFKPYLTEYWAQLEYQNNHRNYALSKEEQTRVYEECKSNVENDVLSSLDSLEEALHNNIFLELDTQYSLVQKKIFIFNTIKLLDSFELFHSHFEDSYVNFISLLFRATSKTKFKTFWSKLKKLNINYVGYHPLVGVHYPHIINIVHSIYFINYKRDLLSPSLSPTKQLILNNTEIYTKNDLWDMAQFDTKISKVQIPHYVSHYYFSKYLGYNYEENFEDIKGLFAFLFSKEKNKLFEKKIDFDDVPRPCSFLFYDRIEIPHEPYVKVWQLQSQKHRFDQFEDKIKENDSWDNFFTYTPYCGTNDYSLPMMSIKRKV